MLVAELPVVVRTVVLFIVNYSGAVVVVTSEVYTVVLCHL